jgi:predicted HAD superfamily Cof-like phosphohydrolase
MLEAAQKSVTDFSRLCDLPVSDSPRELARERVELRAKWMSEEIEEFRNAADIVDQVDAVTDLIYYALGVFVEMGIDGGRVFRFVHEANVTKVRPGEKPTYNTDGKVLKPEGWVPPKERIRQWLGTISPDPPLR